MDVKRVGTKMCKLQGGMDKGGHYDVEMKQMDNEGHYGAN